jgi:four helix bundle protein
MQDFRKIKAWQRAHAMAIALHKLARGFPRRGFPRLRTQLTGAAESIADTIVEGCGAASNKEFGRYLDMSIKSANETEYHLLKARDFDLVTNDVRQKFATETIEIQKMIYVYRRKMLASRRESR